jgi:hypothetical protein
MTHIGEQMKESDLAIGKGWYQLMKSASKPFRDEELGFRSNRFFSTRNEARCWANEVAQQRKQKVGLLYLEESDEEIEKVRRLAERFLNKVKKMNEFAAELSESLPENERETFWDVYMQNPGQAFRTFQTDIESDI